MPQSEVHEHTGIIEIDEHAYFPMQYRDVEFTIRMLQTRPGDEFVKRYSDVCIARVHRDVETDSPPKHHPVWIDTELLVAHKRFLARLHEELAKLEPTPTLIVTPLHSAGVTMGRAAQEFFRTRGNSADLLHHPNLLLSDPPQPGDTEMAVAAEITETNGFQSRAFSQKRESVGIPRSREA